VQSALILIVDDDRDLREALAETLEDAGYEVVAAVDGQEGLRQMRAFRPSVVILDLVMPNMDGWQFRLEQKHDPTLCTTPVIAISASHTAAAAAIDADLFLEKPFPIDQIVQSVETVLAARARRSNAIASAEHERLLAVGTLAAGIAHEVNNPLTYLLLSLTGATRHLERVDAPDYRDLLDRVRRLLRDAVDGAERIRGIIQGIRLFSAGADDRVAAPIDVRQSLESALHLVTHDLEQRARLVTSYDTVPLVIADEKRLGQVFLNLLTNAIQAVPEGDRASHEIRVATRTSAAGHVVVEISDTGAGIAPHVLGRIFEPFFTTKPVGQGTGLGLSISHNIVRALGGEITVTSAVGEGSTFRVWLAPADPNRLVIDRREPEPGDRLRILVVDDEPSVCAHTCAMLRDEHEVVEAGSALEALDRLSANPAYDVVLSDLQMPGMSGLELYRCVRALWPELASSMIFLTGGPVDADAREVLSGANLPILDKPLDSARLHAALATRR